MPNRQLSAVIMRASENPDFLYINRTANAIEEHSMSIIRGQYLAADIGTYGEIMPNPIDTK